MHGVCGFTCEFCIFICHLNTTLNKLFAVFVYYICGFTKEFIAWSSLSGGVYKPI